MKPVARRFGSGVGTTSFSEPKTPRAGAPTPPSRGGLKWRCRQPIGPRLDVPQSAGNSTYERGGCASSSDDSQARDHVLPRHPKSDLAARSRRQPDLGRWRYRKDRPRRHRSRAEPCKHINPFRHRLFRPCDRERLRDRGCDDAAEGQRDRGPSTPGLALGLGRKGPGGPDLEGDPGEPVYRLRVRGTEDLELVYEVVQPDGSTDSLPVTLRRSMNSCA